MKKTIILLIVLISSINIAIANDCKNIVNDPETWEKLALKNFSHENIMPKVAAEKAINNLQKFCCLEDSIKDNVNYCDNVNTDWYFPNSAYLFDHLLDVYLRRLDAKSDDENWKNLIYWLEPDTKWQERRNFISNHANNKDGSVPIQIENEYKKFWEKKSNGLSIRNPNVGLPWSQENFVNYGERSLGERYMWACEISVYLYLNLINTRENTARLHLAYQNCKSLVNNRIKNEYEYTKAIMIQKWNVLLFNNVNNYLDPYFSQNKLMSLQSLVFDIKNTFAEINKAIKELVLHCE